MSMGCGESHSAGGKAVSVARVGLSPGGRVRRCLARVSGDAGRSMASLWLKDGLLESISGLPYKAKPQTVRRALLFSHRQDLRCLW